jgi:hypothetical protein
LEQELHFEPAAIHEERLENGVMLLTKEAVLDYVNVKSYDFDLDENAIDHYFRKAWMFIGVQVYGTFFIRDPLYRIVSNPVRVKTMMVDRKIIYPMVLTGSTSKAGGPPKQTELRLYVITRFRLASYPTTLTPTFEGVLEFDLGDWFVTVLEGTLTSDQMKDDMVIELDRTRKYYE